jgi:hypothetical protein
LRKPTRTITGLIEVSIQLSAIKNKSYPSKLQLEIEPPVSEDVIIRKVYPRLKNAGNKARCPKRQWFIRQALLVISTAPGHSWRVQFRLPFLKCRHQGASFYPLHR